MKIIVLIFFSVSLFAGVPEVKLGNEIIANALMDVNLPRALNMPVVMRLNPLIIEYIKTSVTFARYLDPESEVLNRLNSFDKDIPTIHAVESEEELSSYCRRTGASTYSLPEGATLAMAACTSNNRLFLVLPLFSKLNLRSQALLIIHEMLTHLRDRQGGKNFRAMSALTVGLSQLLVVAHEQQTGKIRVLAPEEVKAIGFFYQGLFELEYRAKNIPENRVVSMIHPLGGGRIHPEAEVAETALVSLTSQVAKASVGEDVRVLDSKIPAGTTIETGSLISHSQLSFSSKNPNSFYIGHRSRIEDSVIEAQEFRIDEENLISHSQIKVESLSAGKKVELVGVKVNFEDSRSFGIGLLYQQSYMLDRLKALYRIHLKPNQRLEDASINFNSSMAHSPPGAKIHYPSWTVKNIKSDCQDSPAKLFKRYEKYQSGPHCLNIGWDIGRMQVPSLDSGIFLNVSQKITEAKLKDKENRIYSVSVLKSLSFSLGFTPFAPKETHKLAMIVDGMMTPVGEYRYRNFMFHGRYWGESYIHEEIKKALQSSMDEVISDYQQHHIFLPYSF